MIQETDILALDANDPLQHVRSQFHLPENLIYLDGNSLGAMPLSSRARVAEVTNQQWGEHLITSWNRHQWVQLPRQVGDKIAKLVGAKVGQVICTDSISVNLFKVLAAAFSLLRHTERREIISTKDNFPTDLYMVEGLAALLQNEGIKLTLVDEAELEAHISEHTLAVLFTQVNFRTGRRLNVANITAQAHQHGALSIVDLAHSAGVMPVELDNWQVDFAVGCTYKYMNAGPGAPAFVYVAERHLAHISQPLSGWFGHAQPFAFEPHFTPATGIEKMLTGTPSVISMAAVDAALNVFAELDMQAIRKKSMAMGQLFADLMQQTGLTEAMTLQSPTDAEQRGSQLSYAHPDAYAICQALIARDVVADFRAPNLLRVGFAPLYNSYLDVWRAVQTLQHIFQSKEYLQPQFQARAQVT